MNLEGFRRSIATVALAGLVAISIVSCTIPTEDQPQPINRDQTTTSVDETP